MKHGCIIVEDVFNRPDGTNLGADWKVLNGTPRIEGSSLWLPVGARVMCTRPTGLPAGVLSFTRRVVDGGRYVVQSVDSEGGNAIELAEWHFHDGASKQSFILPCETATYDCWDEPGAYIGADVIWSDRHQLWMGSAGEVGENSITCCHYPDKHKYFAFYNPGEVEISVDSVFWLRHARELPECPCADCSCDHYCVPQTLLATFTGGLLDGLFCYLEEMQPIGEKDKTIWKGSLSYNGLFIDVEMTCIPWQVPELPVTCTRDGFQIALSYNDDYCWGTLFSESEPGAEGYPAGTIVCDPLTLSFGPFCVLDAPPWCCEECTDPEEENCSLYTVVVTEP